MAQQHQQTRVVVQVLDLFTTAPVTGLTIGAFVVTLKRESGNTLTAASETVTLLEIGSGLYWFQFTPENTGLYHLAVVPATADLYTLTPSAPFQIPVVTWAETSGGPYLCTRDQVRSALGYKDNDTDDDARIDALLAQVTRLAEGPSLANRPLIYAAETELLDADGARAMNLRRYPVVSVVGVWESTAIPRVYDSTTLLVEGTDFLVESRAGILRRLSSRFPCGPHTLKVAYAGGYEAIPEDLNRAAIEVIAVKLQKSKGKGDAYSYTGTTHQDGSIAGIRFDDVPDNARAVFESYAGVLVG